MMINHLLALFLYILKNRIQMKENTTYFYFLRKRSLSLLKTYHFHVTKEIEKFHIHAFFIYVQPNKLGEFQQKCMVGFNGKHI